MKTENKKTDLLEDYLTDFSLKNRALEKQLKWIFIFLILLVLFLILAIPLQQIHSESNRKFPVAHEVKAQ